MTCIHEVLRAVLSDEKSFGDIWQWAMVTQHENDPCAMNYTPKPGQIENFLRCTSPPLKKKP